MVAQRLTQILLPAAPPYQIWQRVEADRSVVPQEHTQSLFESMPRRVAAPDGHGYELVSSVRVLVPQKFSVEEELMHVKHVEIKSPHVGVMWKFGSGVISSGIVLVT
ncbi:hypothetical protein TNCV_3953121 [Trichonephila clavipes]|nr:hypothetical protein TNCV_3953121 [Trichonephila clavipes]